jgi:hypothetical protein
MEAGWQVIIWLVVDILPVTSVSWLGSRGINSSEDGGGGRSTLFGGSLFLLCFSCFLLFSETCLNGVSPLCPGKFWARHELAPYLGNLQAKDQP